MNEESDGLAFANTSEKEAVAPNLATLLILGSRCLILGRSWVFTEFKEISVEIDFQQNHSSPQVVTLLQHISIRLVHWLRNLRFHWDGLFQ
jgi:hypothetical protein